MCLIVFAWDPDSPAPLLLAANRDEFHRRPAAPMEHWPDAPEILAGRDLEAGGTWLGVSRRGRFAAVTNVRDPAAELRSAARSRGDLTRDFLVSTSSAADYLQGVSERQGEYQGFNLLLGDGGTLWYLHGSAGTRSAPRQLDPGIYGLSNAALDVPWPKVRRGKEALRELLGAGGPAPDLAALRDCVRDRSLAGEEELHGAGLPGDMAKRLSAQFIVTPEYGTRCCTTLRWSRASVLEIAEQRFDAAGALCGASEFRLALTEPG